MNVVLISVFIVIIFGFVGNRNLHWSIHCGPGRLDEPQAKMVLREFGQAEVVSKSWTNTLLVPI